MLASRASLRGIRKGNDGDGLARVDPLSFYGAGGWIAIRLDTGQTDWAHIEEWLGRSRRAVAPKRLTRLMNVAEEF